MNYQRKLVARKPRNEQNYIYNRISINLSKISELENSLKKFFNRDEQIDSIDELKLKIISRIEELTATWKYKRCIFVEATLINWKKCLKRANVCEI